MTKYKFTAGPIGEAENLFFMLLGAAGMLIGVILGIAIR